MPIDYSQYKPIQTTISNMPSSQLILPNMSISDKFKYPESKIAPLTQSEQAQLGQRAANLASRVARTSSTEALESAVKSTSPSFSRFSKEAAIKELASRGISTDTPQSKIPSMPTAKSVGTLIPDVGSRPFIPRLGNVTPFVPALVGALLAKPVEALGEATARNIVRPFAENVDRALGLLPSLKAQETFELANRKYDEALKQAQGRQADRQRINNGSGASTNNQAVESTFPNAQTLANAANNPSEGYQALRNDGIWLGHPSGRTFTGVEASELPFYRSDAEAIANNWVIPFQGTVIARAYFTALRFDGVPIVNQGQADRVFATIAPPTDTFANFGGVLDLSGSVPELAKKPSNNPLPFKEPTESPAFNVAPAPKTDRDDRNPVNPNNGLRNGASGFPQIGGASTPSNPSTASPSFNKPAFSARPFISGKSDPSELGNPRDAATGLTRDELEKQFTDKQAKFQNDANANQRQAAANDAKAIREQLNNLSNVPSAANGGKSDRQVATENYENLIKDNPIRREAFNTSRNSTTPQNTTPTTPVSTGNNVIPTVAGLAGIAATITALKLGSDLLVNNSLNNTPKINNIEQNTTPAQQQTNVRTGVCEVAAPDGCIDNAVKRNTDPIKDKADSNAGLLAQILAAIANLASTLAALFSDLVGKLDFIKEFLEKAARAARLDKVYNLLTFLTVVHNASMLSNSIGTTLMDSLSLGLATFGIKDENESPIDIQQIIGKSLENTIKGVIGNGNYTTLSERWKSAVRVYQAGANMIYQVRSLWDSAKSLNELTGANVGRIGNALKRDGVVAENAYPAMADNPMMVNGVMTRLQNLEDAASHLNSITSEAYSVTETVTEIKKNKTDFDKLVKESPITNGTANDAQKAKDDAAKLVSVSPPIATNDLVKPE